MPSCAVITCRARSQGSNGSKEVISFHRFPKEPALKEQWIDATGREGWMPTKTSTVCSKHFTEKDYVLKKSGHKYLKPAATPQEKIVRVICMSDTRSSAAKAQKHKTECTTDEGDLIKCKKVQFNSSTSVVHSMQNTNSYNSEEKTQSEKESLPCSNASSPRKRKLKEIITIKDAVIKKQRLQIKKIQAQNRRLKKKINKIEDILNDLQKNS